MNRTDFLKAMAGMAATPFVEAAVVFPEPAKAEPKPLEPGEVVKGTISWPDTQVESSKTVNFMGESFENGQSHEFVLSKSYCIVDYPDTGYIWEGNPPTPECEVIRLPFTAQATYYGTVRQVGANAR